MDLFRSLDKIFKIETVKYDVFLRNNFICLQPKLIYISENSIFNIEKHIISVFIYTLYFFKLSFI